MPKGLEAKKRFCVGGTSVNFEEMGYKFAWDGKKMSGLTAKRALWKIICLMNSLWEAIAGTNIDLNWLLKVRSHLDKIGKEQEKTKQKKLSSLSRNWALRNWFLGNSMSTFPIFNSNQTPSN